MKSDIANCARCGGSHCQLELQPLTQPVLYLGLAIATHFAPCPTNGQPVLVRVAFYQPHQPKQ